MPRISGVDIPPDKKIRISLRYIYGVGPTNATARSYAWRNAGSISRPGRVPNDAISRWQFPWPSNAR